MTARRLMTLVAAGAFAVLPLAACSSSGGGVSNSQLEAKLKKEPQLQQELGQSTVGNALLDCIAKAVNDQGDPGDVKKYVDGKINFADISGKNKGSDTALKTEVVNCAKTVVKSASPSASG